jgi:hypothetical protein
MGSMGLELEIDSETPPSTAVIEAIAEYQDVDPTDLDHPLFEVIDPDGLDSLIGHNGSNHAMYETTVEFNYDDCRVQVSSAGSVAVSSTPAE